MSDKIKILYVDDEENNLISFQANFRKQYEIYTALSVSDAFILLQRTNFQIIISDQRMPNTTGVEFLEQTLKLHPDCIRLLITGYADIDNVIEAINRGQISKYIQKPWDLEKLALAIDHCVTLYKSRIELKLKNTELQKANNELAKFVYSVSHDLRSPLTSILGLINLAKINSDIKIEGDYIDMIENRVIKLDEFIKKIIDYYKNARDEEIKEIIHFKLLIETIWNSLKHHNSSIKFELSMNQEVLFLGDSLRIKMILENLISNAIKFQNPLEKNPSIKTTILMEENGVHILVSDNGIGISKEYLPNIFELFFRTEYSSQIDGTGIGLYIVKEAIEKIGGTIDVTSTPLIGTSFKLVLPNKNKL